MIQSFGQALVSTRRRGADYTVSDSTIVVNFQPAPKDWFLNASISNGCRVLPGIGTIL